MVGPAWAEEAFSAADTVSRRRLSYIRRHIHQTPLAANYFGRHDRSKTELCRIFPSRRGLLGTCSTDRHPVHQGSMAEDGANLVQPRREDDRANGRPDIL